MMDVTLSFDLLARAILVGLAAIMLATMARADRARRAREFEQWLTRFPPLMVRITVDTARFQAAMRDVAERVQEQLRGPRPHAVWYDEVADFTERDLNALTKRAMPILNPPDDTILGITGEA